MTDLFQDDEYDRRFAGVAKIYGDDSFHHYEKQSCDGDRNWWCWFMGSRSTGTYRIGELTLVDMDVVASNINRQLPAMTATLGCEKSKSWQNAAARLILELKSI